MIRILLLLGFIFYSFPSLAKTINVTGKYSHGSEISAKEGCESALQEAKNEAARKIGVKISSETTQKCSEIEGKSNCERNQFYLSTFNAEFTNLEVLDKKQKTETLNDDEIRYICEIEIVANVELIEQITDPNFDFNAKLNSYNFKSGDKLNMEIEVNTPMYLTIFQFLPYERKGNQVHKLFPNKREENNYIKNKITLPYNAKYEVYFPETVDKKNIDEYLIFLGSEKEIKWLDQYNTIYDLKSTIIRSKYKMKKKDEQYTIYN